MSAHGVGDRWSEVILLAADALNLAAELNVDSAGVVSIRVEDARAQMTVLRSELDVHVWASDWRALICERVGGCDDAGA